MNWFNVKLILVREIRDQLRDRRTLFMIAVLPLLLYPLLGLSFFQIAQFMREQTTRVLLIGAPKTDDLPPLSAEGQFMDALFAEKSDARLLKLDQRPAPSADSDEELTASARALVNQGQYDVVVVFPPTFGHELSRFRARLRAGDRRGEADEAVPVPSPKVYYNTAKEASQISYARVQTVLSRWRDAIGRQNLKESHVPEEAAHPFLVETADVANESHRDAVVWSKILPFVLLLWALTGAFYPAVDLCAGEKERGTLETLLSSPAERSEIAWGKLLTVMIFSMATAVLNLLSMGITGAFVLSQLPQCAPPPASAVLWLLLALVPISALFSALCLAVAAFARSSKEGQYYLMPLVLITMPLIILPMAPGVELNFGNSVIPITGVVLLLRTMLEGNYVAALPYIPAVVSVTLIGCLLAMRWATDQFSTESVLFRESERLDLGQWMRNLRRDREDTPSAAEAILCGVLILVVQFFMTVALPANQDLIVRAAVTQLVVIATPALLMTVILTRSPRKTLLLRMPASAAIPLAVLLAIAVHPLAQALQAAIIRMYPLSDAVEQELARMVSGVNFYGLLLIGIIPALCEELAFRGFILSGLRHLGHRWRAILLSSLLFGVAHPIFQQSLLTCVLGVLLGYLAVQTGSLLPGILFHMLHNCLALLSSQLTSAGVDRYPVLGWFVDASALERYHQMHEGFYYTWPTLVLSAAASALLLYRFHQMPHTPTAEESLQEAIEHHSARPAGA